MREILEPYVDAFVGINYVDPRDTIVAMTGLRHGRVHAN
jgi:hypothetical protein